MNPLTALVASPFLVPAFTMGLCGGVHCVTMCGSASAVLCSGRGRFALAFNAGRATAYTLLGAVAGAVGSWTIGHGIDGLRFGFRALAATTMLMVGLHLAGLPSFLRVFEAAGAPLWRRLSPIVRSFLPLRSAVQAFAAGSLWSLMPCGLLYAALATSAAGYSAFEGAATMAAFAAGTLPAMLGAGALVSRFAGLARGRARRAAGVLVLAFGAWSMAGVAGQAGLVPTTTSCHASPGESSPSGSFLR